MKVNIYLDQLEHCLNHAEIFFRGRDSNPMVKGQLTKLVELKNIVGFSCGHWWNLKYGLRDYDWFAGLERPLVVNGLGLSRDSERRWDNEPVADPGEPLVESNDISG